MQFYTVLQIGDFHTNHCEDFWILEKAGNDLVLCAVMDGCTMGEESYFVATLAGKLLRKIAKEQNYKAFVEKNREKPDLEIEIKAIFKQLFQELALLKNQLFLEQMNC